MKSETLYIAYGGNFNLPQLTFHGPTAKSVGAGELKDYRLFDLKWGVMGRGRSRNPCHGG